jgi:hypothetical protein
METACISGNSVCKNQRTQLTSKFGVVDHFGIVVNVDLYAGKLNNQFVEISSLFLVFIEIHMTKYICILKVVVRTVLFKWMLNWLGSFHKIVRY